MTLHLHIPPEPIDQPSRTVQNRCAERVAELIIALEAVPDHYHRASLDEPETQH